MDDHSTFGTQQILNARATGIAYHAEIVENEEQFFFEPREMYVEPYRLAPIWAFLHDVIAHPLLGLTGCAQWTVRFHDFTSRKSYAK